MLRRKNTKMIIIFLAPAILLYLLVFLYPVFRTFFMSFFSVESVSQPVSTWAFNGLSNYKEMFTANLFKQSVKNIAKIWLVGGVVVMIISLLFAVILTSGIRGKRFFRSIIYLPNVISAVAMGTMWLNYVYSIDFGLFNTILAFLGIKPVLWTGPGMLFWSMLIAYSFGMVGYHMLIFMSGIEQIDEQLFEAATIDGANKFGQFRYITLPLLRPVLKSNITIWTVSAAGFFVWGQLFSPVNLSNDTITPVNYMYELVFGSSSSANTVRNSGIGAAIGVLLSISVVVIFALTNLLVKEKVEN